MTINEAMTALCDELSTEIPDVLTHPLTLAVVWLDLCQLVGEEPPAAVAALVEGVAVEATRVPVGTVRG